MSDACEQKGSTRWFYTGNQVGDLNFVGDYNFVSGGLPGSGISAGVLVPVYFPPPVSREPWNAAGAVLDQKLLDASFPDIELNWAVEIDLKGQVFKLSNKNLYIEDEDGAPRFYEARISKAPSMMTTLGEWLNPNFEIGDLKFTVNNRDGYFNPWLPQGEQYTQWISAKVTVLVGIGQKRSNYFTLYEGWVTYKQGLSTTEDSITIKCYDKFDKDEIPLPPMQFNTINFPDIQDGVSGKGVPLIYGDWTVEVGDYGEVPAYCLNANEENPTSYTFKISANSLSSIGDIYLHRGERKKDTPDGPIKFSDAFITKDEENGQFVVPANLVDTLEDLWVNLDKGSAGPSSGLDLITSDKPTTNFLLKGVKAGDVVIKTKTSERATVTLVTNNQIQTTGGGITFAEGDEYSVITTQYSWRKGDKVSVKCIGKSVKNISRNRLADAGLGTSTPTGLSVGLDGTYWFADNDAQKIYQLNFLNEVVKQIPYSDIDASISVISGLSIQSDNTIWMFDQPSSTVFRYLLDSNELGLSFPTTDVIGLFASLGSGAGLSIDDGNILYVVDNSNGMFYSINPFATTAPTLVNSWSNTAFDALAIETLDLSADVNQDQLCLVDRQTGKFYRINPTTGALIDSWLLTDVNDDMTFVVGVSVAQDGTVFLLNRSTRTLHNYNEFADSEHNVGFIARDVIQSFTGKTYNDFDLSWNAMSRGTLAAYRARLYLDEKTNIVTAMSKFLQQFNSCLYVRFGRYALYHIHFDNFQDNGEIIREGDIKLDSFEPKKEYNQYFNSAYADYAKLPFSASTSRTDTYVSAAAIAAADGKEISKKLDLSWVYRREDVDDIMPLFVRLAAAEPEFVDVTFTWKRLFTQLNDFFRINFDAMYDCVQGRKRGGRRFNLVPAFVRQINFDLDDMTLKMKLWSLGTTRFGNFVPVGPVVGGEFDVITLTNLGTVGFISPTGTITASGLNNVTVEDVDATQAEFRDHIYAGKAWRAGFNVALVDAATEETVEILEIGSVSGQVITFTENIQTTVVPAVKNAAGFIVSGHYLRYAEYSDASDTQKSLFCYFGAPTTSYPTSSAQEVEEQRSGTHNFPDGRIPYILYPSDFAPS